MTWSSVDNVSRTLSLGCCILAVLFSKAHNEDLEEVRINANHDYYCYRIVGSDFILFFTLIFFSLWECLYIAKEPLQFCTPQILSTSLQTVASVVISHHFGMHF